MTTGSINPFIVFDGNPRRVLQEVEEGVYEPADKRPVRAPVRGRGQRNFVDDLEESVLQRADSEPDLDYRPATSTLGLHRVLRMLDDRERSELISTGQLMTFEEDQIISRQGRSVDSVLFIVQGRAKAEVSPPQGTTFKAVVNVLGSGDDVGLLSLLDGAPHSATVTALADVQALAIPMPVIRKHLSGRGICYQALAEIAVERLRTSALWIQAFL